MGLAESSTPSVGLVLSLEGKVALVTGGSRGIGAATVRLLRQAGARVVFSYKSAEAVARALVAECGGDEFCCAIQQELATVEHGQALVAAAAGVFGRIDCLIVNHGIWPPHDQPIATMTTDQWRGTMGVNLDSVFGLVQGFVEHVLPQEAEDPANPIHRNETAMSGPPRAVSTGVRGHIVLVASTAAQRGEAFHADYAVGCGPRCRLEP
jgi:3-oxoacyl-[acyl-carrier protein] reductase